MISTAEALETALAPAAEAPKATKKASAAKPARNAAPKKAKPGKKAGSAKKAPKSAKAAGTREGSKAARVLDLLKRPGGVTSKELMKATGWQPHSVRGFLSGSVSKKMGLTVVSTKAEDGERTYSVKA